MKKISGYTKIELIIVIGFAVSVLTVGGLIGAACRFIWKFW